MPIEAIPNGLVTRKAEIERVMPAVYPRNPRCCTRNRMRQSFLSARNTGGELPNRRDQRRARPPKYSCPVR